MKIQHLTLYTNNLINQKTFYKVTLELKILESTDSMFTVEVGFSQLTFKHSKEDYKYHFCFLIPSNKLQESISWLKNRLDIVKIG